MHGFPGTSTAGRAVGVKRLDLITDDRSLLPGRGASDDAQTHLGGVIDLHQTAESRGHSDVFDEHRLGIDTVEFLESFENDRRRQLGTFLRPESGIADLSFSLPPGVVAERYLEITRPRRSRPPLTRTWSSPTSSKLTWEKSAMTSGVM